MVLMELLLAVTTGVLLASTLAYPLRRRGPGPLRGLLFFFVLVFLAAWAGGVWLVPVGPALLGVPLLGFLLAGVVVALILAAASPAQPSPMPEVQRDSAAAEAIALTLGVFFYLVVATLIVLIAVHYFAPPPLPTIE